MKYETIMVTRKGNVAVVTLNRPERRNAISNQMSYEIYEAVEAANQDPEVGAIVLTGAGKAFCAGADISRFERKGPSPEEIPRPRKNWVEQAFTSKPIVCAINGSAIGAGLTRTLVCDVRIASTTASFSIRFVKLGLVPELASTFLLPQIVGLQAATDLALSGRTIKAEEALRIGLVLKVIAPDELMPEALQLAESYAGNPPGAVREAKRLILTNAIEGDIRKVIKREGEALVKCLSTAEHREAVLAFREKREPDFRALQKKVE
ncbi:MAG: enoyl-CoA hydratase/isomerase family protein [Deltaproteobacteria bacterium]|nr:enoyl-CoA hydratase/isomerase family protein [Deltaproteobacteria bacterium]